MDIAVETVTEIVLRLRAIEAQLGKLETITWRQRVTLEKDAPEILANCRADGVEKLGDLHDGEEAVTRRLPRPHVHEGVQKMHDGGGLVKRVEVEGGRLVPGAAQG